MSGQIALNFAPGLTDQFRDLKECLHAVVYGSRLGLSGCSSCCDLSPSELAKVLSEVEGRKCDVNLIVPIIRATGDKRPLYYLAELFAEDADSKRERALAQLAQLADTLPELLKQAGVAGKRNR